MSRHKLPGVKLSAALIAAAVLTAGGWTWTAVADPTDGTEPIYDIEDAVEETVYIESDIDSDGDGELDRIAAKLIRPGETDDGLEVPVIVQPSPYYGLTLADVRSADRMVPIGEDPRHFSGWMHDYFVPHGYAYIEVEMQGTAESEGCPVTGGEADTASVQALVDWLSGRADAEDADGNPVEADWSLPSIGMAGVSYNGTLPNAIAATGIEEVKTIVPIAAISSWYDYARAEGVAYSTWGDDYPRWLAEYVASDRAKDMCGEVFDELTAETDDDTDDYNDFWDERNYRTNADDMHASTLIVHGQDDFNVKTTHAQRWWDELRDKDVPSKLWLHPDDHVDWTDSPEGHELLHRWFDYWLYDIDTGVMDEPDVMVDRADGSTETYDAWPDPAGSDEVWHFGDDPDSAAGTLSSDPDAEGSHLVGPGIAEDEDYMVSEPGEDKAERQAYLSEPLEAPQRLSGLAELEVTFSSTSEEMPITALLVAYDSDAENYTIVSRGALDGQNHSSLEDGEPLVPDQEYTGVFGFEARDYAFDEGDRIGVVVTSNHSDYIRTIDDADVLEIHLGSSQLRTNLAEG